MTLTKKQKADMTIKVIKPDPNFTTLVVRIPIKLSILIDHHLLNMKDEGVTDLTKSKYVSWCIEAGHKALSVKP